MIITVATLIPTLPTSPLHDLVDNTLLIYETSAIKNSALYPSYKRGVTLTRPDLIFNKNKKYQPDILA